jgi:hypothetical protein
VATKKILHVEVLLNYFSSSGKDSYLRARNIQIQCLIIMAITSDAIGELKERVTTLGRYL